MENLLWEAERSVELVGIPGVGEGECLCFAIVCHFGSGVGPVVSEDCQVCPAAFWKEIAALFPAG